MCCTIYAKSKAALRASPDLGRKKIQQQQNLHRGPRDDELSGVHIRLLITIDEGEQDAFETIWNASMPLFEKHMHHNTKFVLNTNSCLFNFFPLGQVIGNAIVCRRIRFVQRFWFFGLLLGHHQQLNAAVEFFYQFHKHGYRDIWK